MIAIWSGTVLMVPSKFTQSALVRDIGVPSRAYVFKLGQSWRLFEAMAPPGTVIDKLNILEVSDEWQVASAHESSIAHDIAVGIGIHETGIRIGRARNRE